ncbi:MAG: ArnT family glycosyltransferase [Planctomycetota bacterium]
MLTAAVRIRLLDVPLERDEGEYAYGGQLILQGLPEHAPLYNIKPGIYMAYALILAVFGQTQSAVHMGLVLINVATIILLFLLAKRLFDPVAALAAAAVFAVLSLDQSVVGLSANREHFVILPVLAGIILLLRAIDCQEWLSLLAAAVFFGLAFLMKENGAVFIIFAGLYLLLCELRRRPFGWKLFLAKGALFSAGALLPFAVLSVILLHLGMFEMFWFWRFVYTRQYASVIPLSVGLKLLRMRMAPVVGSAILIWILSAIGLAGLFWNTEHRRKSPFVAGFLIFSFLSICPGLYFRPHYFILLLPAVALLAGLGLRLIAPFLSRGRTAAFGNLAPAILVFIALCEPLYKGRAILFELTPWQVSRRIYGLNPFPESVEIGRFIRQNSTKDDSIAVLGSEPQIYFYSHRHSATGYMYTYQMMGKYDFALRVQNEMIREIESARPKFLVFVDIPASWLAEPDSDRTIFKWFSKYHRKYYNQVGVIEIISTERTLYHWNDDAAGYVPRSRFWVRIFQRKTPS